MANRTKRRTKLPDRILIGTLMGAYSRGGFCYVIYCTQCWHTPARPEAGMWPVFLDQVENFRVVCAGCRRVVRLTEDPELFPGGFDKELVRQILAETRTR